MQTFSASLDTTAKIVTVVIFLTFSGITLLIFAAKRPIIGLCMSLFCLAVFLGCYLYSVRSYEIDENNLVIKRPIAIFNINIPLSEIKEVRQVSSADIEDSRRDFGVDGVFGYFGSFSNDKLGDFSLYATNDKTNVMITLKHNAKIIIISPDDIGLIAEINKRIR